MITDFVQMRSIAIKRKGVAFPLDAMRGRAQAGATLKTQVISIPIHPDDKDVPVSLVHIPLGNGRYATICGPFGCKTLTALQGTLEACKDVLVSKPDDFEI